MNKQAQTQINQDHKPETVAQPEHGRGRGVQFHGIGWTAPDDVAPRRTDWGVLPDGLADIVQRGGGDITGRGRGAVAMVDVSASPAPGAPDDSRTYSFGTVRCVPAPVARPVAMHKARAVGVGDDDETRRANAFADWLQATMERTELEEQGAVAADEIADEIAAKRGEIASALASEQDTARRILALAGGPGWGDGRTAVKFTGAGMAARAARFIVHGNGRTMRNGRTMHGRGVQPSQTSLEDAAAAAVAVMVREWCDWQSVFGEDTPFDAARHRLCAVAWRAAFASLTHDASEGRTGRKAGQTEHGGTSAPLDTAQLEIEKRSLEHWAQDRMGRMFNPGEDDGAQARRARRRVLQWVASVLDVNARHKTVRATERARFSLIARLIHGRDIASAARGAGFATGRAAVESFRSGKVWARLRANVVNHKGAHERGLLALRRRAARRAVAAIREQRQFATGAGGYGVPGYVLRERRQWVNGKGGGIGGHLATDTREARVTIANPFAGEWLHATDKRGAAVATAHAARRLIVATRRERGEQFDKATRGLRAGWLH